MPLGFALVIVITLLSSYHAYVYDSSLLLVAFFLTGAALRERHLDFAETLMAIAVYALFLVPVLLPALTRTAMGLFAGMLVLAGAQFAKLEGVQLEQARTARLKPAVPI